MSHCKFPVNNPLCRGRTWAGALYKPLCSFSGNGSRLYCLFHQMNTENEGRPASPLKCRANSGWGRGGGRWKEREHCTETVRQETQRAGEKRKKEFSGVESFFLHLRTAVRFPVSCVEQDGAGHPRELRDSRSAALRRIAPGLALTPAPTR